MSMKFLPTSVEIPEKKSAEAFFDDLRKPTELGVGKWLDEICQAVVTSSPIPVIRSCASFVERQKQFKNELFPVAFLSCWEEATDATRDNFSNIISSILKEHSKVHLQIFKLAEITDRALLPFSVSYIQLASKCDIKELSLYFLQKEHQMYPTNFSVVNMLLRLNSSMGRNISAQGLLAQTNTARNKISSARWNECLGDWQHALDLYDESPVTLSNRIRCYAHLQMWEKIRNLEPEFWKMSKVNKESNVRHFAWAFYNAEEWSKVSKLIPYFPTEMSLSDLIFRAVFALKQGRLIESNEYVTQGFKLLASNTSVYGGGDINKASDNLSAAQLFVEISEACKIMACRCVKDLDALLCQYANDFSKIKEEQAKKQLNKTLSKIGMTFENGVLSINNENRWKRVSMIERVKMKMPSTTNTLEATHGHLNAATPRKNDFWSSMNRITTSLLKKDFHMDGRIKNVYNNEKRRVSNRVKMVSREIFEKELDFYKPKIEECTCGETALVSSMLRLDIPCSHRVFLGAKFPELPKINLILTPSMKGCKFKYTLIDRELPIRETAHLNWLKKSAVEVIKRYSHFKHRSMINSFVEDNFKIGTSFVNGKPVEFYSLVHEGIFHFDNLRKVKEHLEGESESGSVATESE